MPSNTPLTDAIEALTQYANETTGASDTNLSDAVGTLVAGYGGGGGDTLHELLANTLVAYTDTEVSGALRESAFKNNTNLESISLPNITEISAESFYNCQKLASVNLPNVGSLWGNGAFRQTYALKVIAFPKLTRVLAGSQAFFNGRLETGDFGLLQTNGFGNNFFVNCPLTTIVLRYNGVCPLNSTGAFNSTPFASGGEGGEIYVPSAQIESYKVASNWSTVHGWGTVTWKAIEGSYYETHYADGTVIE